MKAADADPSVAEAFFKQAKMSPGDTPLERFQNTPLKQKYVSTDVQQSQVQYTFGPTQANKTGNELLYIFDAAEKKMPAVISVQPSTEEFEKYCDGAAKFNQSIDCCFEEAGIPEEERPSLKMYHHATFNDYAVDLPDWMEGITRVIPVFLAMLNGAKVEAFKNTALRLLDRCPKDDEGRISMVAVFDEGDTTKKTSEGTADVEKALGSDKPIPKTKKARKTRGGPNKAKKTRDSLEEAGKTPDSLKTLYEKFSTINFVTATPQALSVNDMPKRTSRVVVRLAPSQNDHQYDIEKHPEWVCHGISRVPAESQDVMIQDMIDSPDDRIAMVMTTSESSKDARGKKALETAKANASLVTISWSKDEITIWTKNPVYQKWIDSDTTNTWVREVLEDELVKWEGTKGGINCYRQLMDLLHRLRNKLAERPALKSILYSSEMTARSTSVKGLEHVFALTDQYIDFKTHDERLNQCGGRLCGIDPEFQRQKILWATKELHNAHELSLEHGERLVTELLATGTTIREAL